MTERFVPTRALLAAGATAATSSLVKVASDASSSADSRIFKPAEVVPSSSPKLLAVPHTPASCATGVDLPFAGSRNHFRDWQFTGRAIDSDETDAIRIQIVGESDLEGGPDAIGRGIDGRQWEHRVSLAWQGYVDLHGDQIASLQAIAEGDERLRWGNDRFHILTEPSVQHLMAGHPIDFRGPVRYGLTAKPAENAAERDVDPLPAQMLFW